MHSSRRLKAEEGGGGGGRKGEIDRKSCLLRFIRARCDVTSAFYVLKGRSEARKVKPGYRRGLSTRYLLQRFSNERVPRFKSNNAVSGASALISKLYRFARLKLRYFCLEGDPALYYVSSITLARLCIDDASRAISRRGPRRA